MTPGRALEAPAALKSVDEWLALEVLREEVEGYLLRDPFVKRGRLAYEVHPWFGAIGTRLK